MQISHVGHVILNSTRMEVANFSKSHQINSQAIKPTVHKLGWTVI